VGGGASAQARRVGVQKMEASAIVAQLEQAPRAGRDLECLTLNQRHAQEKGERAAQGIEVPDHYDELAGVESSKC
jgi:hypothetical protein